MMTHTIAFHPDRYGGSARRDVRLIYNSPHHTGWCASYKPVFGVEHAGRTRLTPANRNPQYAGRVCKPKAVAPRMEYLTVNCTGEERIPHPVQTGCSQGVRQ